MIYAFLLSILLVYPAFFLFFAGGWARAAFLGYITWSTFVDTKVGRRVQGPPEGCVRCRV